MSMTKMDPGDSGPHLQLSQEDTDTVLEQVEEISRMGPARSRCPPTRRRRRQKREKRSVWRKRGCDLWRRTLNRLSRLLRELRTISNYTGDEVDSGEDNAAYPASDAMGNLQPERVRQQAIETEPKAEPQPGGPGYRNRHGDGADANVRGSEIQARIVPVRLPKLFPIYGHLLVPTPI